MPLAWYEIRHAHVNQNGEIATTADPEEKKLFVLAFRVATQFATFMRLPGTFTHGADAAFRWVSDDRHSFSVAFLPLPRKEPFISVNLEDVSRDRNWKAAKVYFRYDAYDPMSLFLAVATEKPEYYNFTKAPIG